MPRLTDIGATWATEKHSPLPGKFLQNCPKCEVVTDKRFICWSCDYIPEGADETKDVAGS